MAGLGPPPDDFYGYRPATVECVVQAASKQGVPANVLLAIASQEGGKNGQLVRNKDGSLDISHFQVNSETWRTELVPFGVTLYDLQWRGCYNAEVAAFLLGTRLHERGDDFWTKAANYHTRTPKYNAPYRATLMTLSVEWAQWLQHHYSAVQVSYR